MPFNGTGGFDPLPPPTYPAIAGDTIRAAYFNAVIDDIRTGLSGVLVRDGQSAMTGNLNLGGSKVINAANATNAQDYTTLAQNTAAYLTRAVGTYATSSEGKSRLFFVNNGATYIRGHDAALTFAVENAAGTVIASFKNDGRVSCTADATAADDIPRYAQVQALDTAVQVAAITAATAAAAAAAAATQLGGTSQTWQDVLASRTFSTTYTNSTGRPIFISIGVFANSGAGGANGFLNLGALSVAAFAGTNFAAGTLQAIVPAGGTYTLTGSGSIAVSFWSELR